ncbi:response regulator transcription factor [Murimonas intestini]|uniref:response regulator transcription factor n=1 Tax=Murimonas intestini TaxID=1337051 RepID=UPI00248ACDB3|nr:helix-turn-helix domain-containing protein [Murimonas intestini]
MNVLIVDDQKAVVESLKNGIRWERLPVEKIYTACSAKEAKLVLMNFETDVLVSDIEMPEEDGISLCRWAKEKFEGLECIFLTSHAEFEYAKEAIRMGGFDYILQPVRYEEVEKVLLKAWEKISRQKKILQIMDTRKMVIQQRNTILDAMISKMLQGKEEDAGQIYSHFHEMFRTEYKDCGICPVLVQIRKWKKITNVWDEKLVRMVLCNVMEELFREEDGKAGVSCLRENRYWVFLILEKEKAGEELVRQKIMAFYQFIDSNMDFSIAVYPSDPLFEQDFVKAFNRLGQRADNNKDRQRGIYWEDIPDEIRETEEDPIEKSIQYIKQNLNKNISRTDVAGYVHLNEEYFSRLFKQETGATFKDYILMEKMKAAQKLLEKSRLSVSIIASKVGYDNFSHFSKMFKKVTNQTPQEYRKEKQKS